ncbi:hypothetical protein ACLKMH_12130 [Psychromonas sp. KJ10-10]|uniref:hypothetical protein n=1 Tax=Psychromonas sp. KJ10-10 TaxID=3391823 RepID=UPI0039B45D42
MSTIDYTKYSIGELLDVKRSISPDTENYPAFIAEFKSREHEVAEYYQKLEDEAFSFAEHKIKVLGYLQLLGGALIGIYLLMALINGSTSLLSTVIAVPLIALNIIAGYTLVKENTKFYWLSILNQALQVPSFAIGSVFLNYSGLGGAYIKFNNIPEFVFGVTAKFSPGFSLQEYTGVLAEQFISIDVLAIAFIAILVKVKRG